MPSSTEYARKERPWPFQLFSPPAESNAHSEYDTSKNEVPGQNQQFSSAHQPFQSEQLQPSTHMPSYSQPYGSNQYHATEPWHAPVHEHATNGIGPGETYVALPRMEAQPWVRDVMSWLGTHTTGVARVDLRRPLPPASDQYMKGNLLFTEKKGSGSSQRRFLTSARGRRERLQVNDVAESFGEALSDGHGNSGARIKITRNLLFFQDPEGIRKPWIDIGIGASAEMDSRRIRPVARLKIGNLFSIKAFPLGVIKVSHCLPLFKTGLSAKVLYEVPLQHANSFWRPPARLMVRLDNISGSGLHLTPTGVEFDEKLVRFSSHLAVRAALGFTFPRSLPIDRECDEFGFTVHRLSLKSKW